MLKIPRIDYLPQCVSLKDIPSQSIACNNWEAEFPYTPEVSFAAAHNGTHLFLTFRVRESNTMALVTQDNGEVWTDSAVEFFISFDDTGYYNFEFTCIGKALLGFRQNKMETVHANSDIMSTILRGSSLGEANFEERIGDNSWELNVTIPTTAFFAHNIATLSGLSARANAYKCGDGLSKPHFLSWQPIKTEKPNFHVPEFFGEILFDKA